MEADTAEPTGISPGAAGQAASAFKVSAASTGYQMFTRGGELIRSQSVILAALAVWAFAPLAAAVIHVEQHGGVLTGTNGADFFDQFQYLAWTRDAGSHFLASNMWVIGHTPHDYLQPMYLISGLLWRLGVSIQLAYLVWKPVAVLVLFLGAAAYVRRVLPRRGQQAAALVLALFYESPVLAVSAWTGHLSTPHMFQLILASGDANSALSLWGIEHAAIAVGLAPIFLIAAERVLSGPAESSSAWGWSSVAAIAGLLVSWLYPWQALTLLAIVAGMFALKPPRRRYRALAIPIVATLSPLIYSFVLTHSDASWHGFETQIGMVGTAPWWALLASFGPLVAVAALGMKRPREDGEWMLLLWPIACVVVYFLVPVFPPHALAGVALPLGVLAVRGWRRVWRGARMPRPFGALLGTAATCALVAPAAVYNAQGVHGSLANTLAGAVQTQWIRLTPNQAAALGYLARAPRAGGVLAPSLLSMSVPEFTGRHVYAGHENWEPGSNLVMANEFFDSGLKDPRGRLRRAILKQSKATFVIADCLAPTTLATDIAPIALQVKRFGCVTVYEKIPHR